MLRVWKAGFVPRVCGRGAARTVRGLGTLQKQTPCGLWVDRSLPASFDKILIANRGEIACRVIRTARELGVRTVSVFSDADAGAQHVLMADEAVRIGPPAAAESYLLGDRILEVAAETGAQAIHPGYGFLSENSAFADECAARGIKFIGPPSAAISAMGSKSASKNIMTEAKVPVVPGYHGDDQSVERLRAEADKIGYPLMIKAVLGGGGKGMRIVRSADEFEGMLESAKRESLKSFKDDVVLLERYIEEPRHIEFQVFADQHGNALHLYERDCSVQRRHQKVLEEAPAPGMSAELRAQMGKSAVDAARAVGYEGAGTVEFIFDAATDDYFFMEMNTRLQVEHPVSEMITKRDLVQWQLHVAAGHPLPATQDDIEKGVSGHALEARIYAEDPHNGFLPAVGELSHVSYPPVTGDCRVETGITTGDEVSIFYDPMIAKLVVWGADRTAALDACDNALSEFQIVGCPTNIPFLKRCIQHEAFRQGGVTTNFIGENQDALLGGLSGDAAAREDRIAAALAAYGVNGSLIEQAEDDAFESYDPWSPWTSPDAGRINESGTYTLSMRLRRPAAEDEDEDVVVIAKPLGEDGTLEVQVGGTNAEPILVEPTSDSRKVRVGDRVMKTTIVPEGRDVHVFFGDSRATFEIPQAQFGASDADAGDGCFTPMAGKVVKVFASEGQEFKKGDQMLIIEAMKMEHVVKAPRDGVVASVYCADGDVVQGNKLAVSFESA